MRRPDSFHTLSVRRNIGLLTLAPLPDVDARDMVLACRPSASAATVESVVAAAEGSPFLVEELLAAPGLPPPFTASVQARLAELDPAARAVIVAAAMLGRQVDWWLLSAACGQEDDTMTAALAAARDRLLVDMETRAFAAVALARRVVPDVMLMDIRMPELDGIEATRLICADPALQGVRVVVLTTYALDEYVFAALRAGASGFLLKDIDPADLRAAVRVVAAGDALLSPTVTRTLIEAFTSGPQRSPADLARLATLTDREREVTALASLGLDNTAIAARLLISPATAKTHIARAMTKVGARDRAQLVVLAYQTGLVSPPLA